MGHAHAGEGKLTVKIWVAAARVPRTQTKFKERKAA